MKIVQIVLAILRFQVCFLLESDGGLKIAPTLLVVIGLSERSLTIGFLVAPTLGGGGQLV